MLHQLASSLSMSLSAAQPAAEALGADAAATAVGFLPANWTSAGMLLLFGSIASMGGIGGGAMVVTIFMVFDGLTPHNAIPLSKAVVFCGTVFSTCVNLLSNRKGADGKRGGNSVDADIVVVLVPGALSGTFLGVGLNRVLPGEALIVILLITLIVTCWMTAKRCHEDLTREAMAVEANPQGGGDESQPLRTTFGPPASESGRLEDRIGALGLLVGLLFLTVAAGVIMRLSLDCVYLKYEHIEEPCESQILRAIFGNLHDHPTQGFLAGGPFALFFSLLPGVICLSAALMITTAFFSRPDFLTEHHERSTLRNFAYLGVLAGLLAGLVGVGGGLIFAPGMLFLGVDALTTVATSTFCVLFTSSSTTLQYLFLSRIILQLVPVYAVVNILASLIGTSAIITATKYGVPKSFVSFTVLLAVTTSAVFSCVKLQSLLGEAPEALAGLPSSFLTEGIRYHTHDLPGAAGNLRPFP